MERETGIEPVTSSLGSELPRVAGGCTKCRNLSGCGGCAKLFHWLHFPASSQCRPGFGMVCGCFCGCCGAPRRVLSRFESSASINSAWVKTCRSRAPMHPVIGGCTGSNGQAPASGFGRHRPYGRQKHVTFCRNESVIHEHLQKEKKENPMGTQNTSTLIPTISPCRAE